MKTQDRRGELLGAENRSATGAPHETADLAVVVLIGRRTNHERWLRLIRRRIRRRRTVPSRLGRRSDIRRDCARARGSSVCKQRGNRVSATLYGLRRAIAALRIRLAGHEHFLCSLRRQSGQHGRRRLGCDRPSNRSRPHWRAGLLRHAHAGRGRRLGRCRRRRSLRRIGPGEFRRPVGAVGRHTRGCWRGYCRGRRCCGCRDPRRPSRLG